MLKYGKSIDDDDYVRVCVVEVQSLYCCLSNVGTSVGFNSTIKDQHQCPYQATQEGTAYLYILRIKAYAVRNPTVPVKSP